jgi:nucleotide-binding universal stress UspA family protein
VNIPRRILCPVDLSKCSARALQYAAAFREATAGRLTLLWVRTTHGGAPGELDAFARSVLGPNAPATLLQREGIPATEILRAAAAGGADLIVMGTHGRTGARRLLLGSVTESVLRRSPCPILVVPRTVGAIQDGALTVRTIVCGIDFSSASVRALEYATALATVLGGHVVAVHALEWSEEEDTSAAPGSAMFPTGEQDARSLFDDLVQPRMPAGPSLELAVAYGDPADAIQHIARERQAGLIVLGIQGRNAIDLAVFGSTTQRVVRESECPLLAVMPPGG